MTQQEYSNRVAQLNQLKHMQAAFIDSEDPYEVIAVTDGDPDVNEGIQNLVHAFDNLITIIQEKMAGGKEEARQVRRSAARRIA